MNKSKSILIGVALFAATVSYAQTNSDVSQTFIDHALQSSNITGAVYGTYFNQNHAFGGGVMALYNINDYISAGLGSDYAGEWRMFSGTVTVHYHFVVTPKLSLTLYGLAAAGTSIGGAGSDNGALATGEGGGFHWNYQLSDKWSAGLGAGYVQRQSCGDFSGGSEMGTLSIGFKF
jgi:hypothetical protein